MKKLKRIKLNKSRLRQPGCNTHFMLNVLGSIRYLCEKDSVRAAEMVGYFSRYLRGVCAFVPGAPIAFNSEFATVESYLELEKHRFNWLSVSYDINETGFMLPARTLLTAVENIIAHAFEYRNPSVHIVFSTTALHDKAYVSIKNGEDSVEFVFPLNSEGDI